MVCTSCNEYKLLLLFEEHLLSCSPRESKKITELLNDSIEIDGEDFECFTCGGKVICGESYIIDYEWFSEEIFKYMAKVVMENIECCEMCGEGADIQGLYFSIKSHFYDKEDDPEAIFDGIDTASTVENVMYDVLNSLWDQFYNGIVRFIECPKCDNGSGIDWSSHIDNGTFSLYTNVYTKSDIDQFNHDFYGDELDIINVEISELAKNISLYELVTLKNDYLQNKAYVAKHPFFYKLERFISKLLFENNYYELAQNRIIFRARTSPIGRRLDKHELWEPPACHAEHGRYNDVGVSVLYCANNKEVLTKEVPLPCGREYYFGKFSVHKAFKLFPINYVFGGEFSGLIDETIPHDQQTYAFKHQYIIGNIISAICFQVGYDGVVYTSTKDKVSANYALFISKFIKMTDIEILDVEIMV